jgi:hypothetical protein
MTREHWTASEKKIARRVFDAAVQRELAEIMAELKARAAAATSPAEMWAIEDYLRSVRHELDRKYDYRYSQLPIVFGLLLREARIAPSDLEGLAEDKIAGMLQIAAITSRKTSSSVGVGE